MSGILFEKNNFKCGFVNMVYFTHTDKTKKLTYTNYTIKVLNLQNYII